MRAGAVGGPPSFLWNVGGAAGERRRSPAGRGSLASRQLATTRLYAPHPPERINATPNSHTGPLAATRPTSPPSRPRSEVHPSTVEG